MPIRGSAVTHSDPILRAMILADIRRTATALEQTSTDITSAASATMERVDQAARLGILAFAAVAVVAITALLLAASSAR